MDPALPPARQGRVSSRVCGVTPAGSRGVKPQMSSAAVGVASGSFMRGDAVEVSPGVGVRKHSGPRGLRIS